MATLTLTEEGKVICSREILEHSGIQAGEDIELDLLPDGRASLRVRQATGSIEDFIGLLAGKTDKVASIEEINEATAAGWAGLV